MLSKMISSQFEDIMISSQREDDHVYALKLTWYFTGRPACPAGFLPPAIFFFTQNRGGACPSPRSATAKELEN